MSGAGPAIATSPLLCSSGTSKGILSFKGCSSAFSYPPQISYLVSPPGVSVASYSRVCRSYLCNNLTNLEPFVRLKASQPVSTLPSGKSCPTCVGKHDEECLPSFVTTQNCPFSASTCYSSTLQFQAGESRTSVKRLPVGSVRSVVALAHPRDWWDPEVRFEYSRLGT